MTIGYGLSFFGALFFLMGLRQILPGFTEESIAVGTSLLQTAGWFTTAGWLVQRVESGRLLSGNGNTVLSIIRKAVWDICLPLTLLLLLFVSVTLLVGMMFAPFLLFVFQRLF